MDTASIRDRLRTLGGHLDAPPKPLAAYVPAVEHGGLVHVSGQLPLAGEGLVAQGVLTDQSPLEPAQAAARRCGINILTVLDAQLAGEWDRLVRIVRLGVYVASDASFMGQHLVANGASELMAEVLGDRGRHARAAVGVPALPLGATVEIDAVAAVTPREPGRG